MKIAITKEKVADELRVAASPDTVKKLIELGAEVVIESNAGINSSITDKDFAEAGATIEKIASKILKEADIVLKVQPISEETPKLKKNAVIIGILSPFENKGNIEALAKSQITSFAMEFVPRITRAQAMDVLSSQSNLAGYKAVLDGVDIMDKVVPMMMTAAGTIHPAKILILGAGVAGLQAIATAKRLGAVVSAFDVRADVKEQVESLGAKFVEVKTNEGGEAEGGYAKEMSEDYKRKQSELINETIKSQDLVITTALIPGKAAPTLITEDMVKTMKQGSVIVDLAAVAGGNCECTIPGKVATKHGVSIIGHKNFPSRVSRDATMLYAKNLLNFVSLIIDKEGGEIKIDMKDEIIKESIITHKGKIINSRLSTEPKIRQGARKRPSAKKEPPKNVVKRKPHQSSKPKAKKQVRKR